MRAISSYDNGSRDISSHAWITCYRFCKSPDPSRAIYTKWTCTSIQWMPSNLTGRKCKLKTWILQRCYPAHRVLKCVQSLLHLFHIFCYLICHIVSHEIFVKILEQNGKKTNVCDKKKRLQFFFFVLSFLYITNFAIILSRFNAFSIGFLYH